MMEDEIPWEEDPTWMCLDCGEHTGLIGEYYMVKDGLWAKYGARRGMLCIGCIEARMGRTLSPVDFTDCILNSGKSHFSHSHRLLSRLGRGYGVCGTVGK